MYVHAHKIIMQGCKLKHSHPSCAEVKNEWNYTSALLVSLRGGVHRANFTFILTGSKPSAKRVLLVCSGI
jgi:hypothetical protein